MGNCEDINESTITALSSLPSCLDYPDSGNERALWPWLSLFHMFRSKVLTALFPILHQVDIIFQCSGFKWGKNELDNQQRQQQRALQHLMCYRKILDFEEKWNSALKLLLYCFLWALHWSAASLPDMYYLEMGPRANEYVWITVNLIYILLWM